MALNVAIPVPGGRRRQRPVRLLGIEFNLGPCALVLGAMCWQRVLVLFIRVPGRGGDGRGGAEKRARNNVFEQHVGSVDVQKSDLPSIL